MFFTPNARNDNAYVQNFFLVCLAQIQITDNFSQTVFLAVQDSSIGDIVTDSLTHSLTQWDTFCFLTLKSDPRDQWPLRHLITVMRKHDLTNILKIFDKFDKFDNFWQFCQFLTIFDNFDNFWQLWPFLQFVYNFDNGRQFWQFRQLLLPFWHLKRQSWRLVTFETLIKIQTIENLNSWQSLWPDN